MNQTDSSYHPSPLPSSVTFLPTEEQPLEYYQQLYTKHAAARISEPAAAAAAAAAVSAAGGAPGVVHILADGSATTEAIPHLGCARAASNLNLEPEP